MNERKELPDRSSVALSGLRLGQMMIAERDQKQASQSASPTKSPVHPAGLNSVLERNIEALQARRTRQEKDATLEEQAADVVTRFAGSMRFVYLHLAVFGLWLLANVGWLPFVAPWDPSFVMLAMIASVEAI